MGKPIAKKGDQVVGLDTHVIMVSSPGGPVPTPIPHPFTGGLDESLSSAVFIDNEAVAVVGSVANGRPPHVPMGGPFQSPPSNRATVSQGSSTVFVDNAAVARADKMLPRFEPASPMGVALRYLKNQWSRLIVFVDEPMLPIHNNASESALRIVALARKNSLFFGNALAGKRFAILYSLTAMCARHGVNPEAYLTDVLIRIHDHPKSRLAELLPDQWKLRFPSAGPGGIIEPVDAT